MKEKSASRKIDATKYSNHELESQKLFLIIENNLQNSIARNIRVDQ